MRSRDSAECQHVPSFLRGAESLHSKPATRAGIDGHPSTQRAPCGAHGNTRTQTLSSNIMLRIPHVSTHARDRAAAFYHGCPAMVSAGIKTKGSRARNQEKKETRAVRTCAARLRRVHLRTHAATRKHNASSSKNMFQLQHVFAYDLAHAFFVFEWVPIPRPGHARTRTPGS